MKVKNKSFDRKHRTSALKEGKKFLIVSAVKYFQ